MLAIRTCGQLRLPPVAECFDLCPGHSDVDVIALEILQHPAEVLSEHLGCFGLEAAQPDVPFDRIHAPPLDETPVERHQDGVVLGRVNREVVVLPLSGEPRVRSCPAKVTFAAERPAHADGDVVVEEEPHGAAPRSGGRRVPPGSLDIR